MRIRGDRRQGHGSIRTRLTAVVVFSALALVVMWVAVSLPRLFDAIYLRVITTSMEQVMPKAVGALSAVEQEREQSLLQIGSGSGELTDRRVATDQAVKSVRDLVEPVLSQSPKAVQDKYAEFNRVMDQLGGVRRQMDSRSISRADLYVFFNRLTDASINVFDAMAHAVPDQETAFSGVEVNSLFRAAEEMSRAATLVSGAITAGSLNSGDHAEFARLSGAYRQQLEMSTQNSSPEVRARYQALRAGDDWKRLTAAEDKVISAGPWTVVTTRNRTEGQVAAAPVSEQEWRDVTGKVYVAVEQLAERQFADSSKLASDRAASGLATAIVGSVIALLVAIATIVAALRIMRSTARRLTRLRYETLDLAVEKLPPIVQRLRAGEDVNMTTELPPLDFGRDEIGQVARAFNAAHSTAVEAAVQESQARAGIRNVFLGIAHRSQALVHRQLKILDKLEREEEDPKQLEDLFNLDHLATRARRNAENLIILGGQQPGRAWRRPVMLVDILRGAIAETTQYKRIRLQGVPRVLVIGTAVADTMHLLAELLDNATSFSPPQAQVRLSGEPAAKGILVEVEDNGLGMEDEDRERHNAVLAQPPDFDAMARKGDPRLGLFVVARLAARHGIKVELRSSSYGGTRAIVLIPATLLAEDEQESTAVLDPVNAATSTGLPASEFVDDVLPFRVALTTPGEAGTTAKTTATRIDPRPGPTWPAEETPEATPDLTGPETPQPRAAEPPAGSTPNNTPGTAAKRTPGATLNTTSNSTSGSTRTASSGGSANGPSVGTPGGSVTGGSAVTSNGPSVGTPDGFSTGTSATTSNGPSAGAPGGSAGMFAARSNGPSDVTPAAGTSTAKPRVGGDGAVSDASERPALPRRRRQASLAPQLRETAIQSEEPEADLVDGRSPEEIRTIMSAFHRESRRARTDDGPGEREQGRLS